MTKDLLRVVVLPDIHFGEEDERAVNLVLKFLKDFKVDRIILLGDLLEMEAVSNWKRNSPDIKYLKDEFNLANKFLDDLGKFSDDIVYLMGNHENRLKDYINNKAPELFGILDIDSGLHLKERKNIQVIEYGIPYIIGKKVFIHGFYTTKDHALKTGQVLGKSVTTGHNHDFQSATVINLGSLILSTSCGCLCKLNKEFMKNRPSAWIHGFQINYFFDSGHFNEHNIIIHNYRFVWNDKLYKN
jgi:predicted phosphodiesterase